MTTTVSFGELHFGTADLKHKARTAALVKIANCLHRHPGGTLPEKLHSPKDYKCMARLVKHETVTHETVLAAPLALTRQKMRTADGVVLVLHDTTELDYSGLKSITDLGSIGGDLNRGLLCHNSLAFDPVRQEVLGLANQMLHRRKCRRQAKGTPKQREGVQQKRERTDRESRLWVKGAQAVGQAPAGKQWVHVADRGADTFEFLASLLQQDQPQGFVIRACSKRNIRIGHEPDGAVADLKTHAKSLISVGSRTVEVGAQGGQPARTAVVSVSFAPVLVLPPHTRRGDYKKEPLALWVVYVCEEQPPKGVEPLDWLLLTNVPVTATADAWERVDWYGYRWVLEEYHKAQKTGCGIEKLQFCSSGTLEPMIALLSVVAVTLLKLRDAARRPDAKERRADDIVDPQYVKVLSAWRLGKPKPDWSIHDFFLALARLGGHQNRKRDKRPGWVVLWKGWMPLQHMVAGAETSDG